MEVLRKGFLAIGIALGLGGVAVIVIWGCIDAIRQHRERRDGRWFNRKEFEAWERDQRERERFRDRLWGEDEGE